MALDCVVGCEGAQSDDVWHNSDKQSQSIAQIVNVVCWNMADRPSSTFPKGLS